MNLLERSQESTIGKTHYKVSKYLKKPSTTIVALFWAVAKLIYS